VKRLYKIWEIFWLPELSSKNLALVRGLMFLGALILVQRPDFNEGLYQAKFWKPIGFFNIFSGPLLSRESFYLIWNVWLFSGVMATLGLFYRLSGPVASLSLMFIIGYDYNFGHVYHSYHVISLNLLIIAFFPASNSWSLDSLFIRKQKSGKAWFYGLPIRLCMFHIVYVMTSNAVQKLYYSGFSWVFSDNLLLQTKYIPGLKEETKFLMVNYPSLFILFAGVVIFIQLFSFLSLLRPSIGLVFSILWASFHFGVSFVMGGHTSFFSQIAAYSVFLVYFAEKKYPQLFYSLD
jgi:hypothetical protein